MRIQCERERGKGTHHIVRIGHSLQSLVVIRHGLCGRLCGSATVVAAWIAIFVVVIVVHIDADLLRNVTSDGIQVMWGLAFDGSACAGSGTRSRLKFFKNAPRWATDTTCTM